MLINLEYPIVPKGVSIKIDGSIDDDDVQTIARVKDVVAALKGLRGGYLGRFRKLLRPDLMQQITDKATDAVITGIAAEAKKVG